MQEVSSPGQGAAIQITFGLVMFFGGLYLARITRIDAAGQKELGDQRAYWIRLIAFLFPTIVFVLGGIFLFIVGIVRATK